MDSRVDVLAPRVPGYDLHAGIGRGSSGTVWSATRAHDGAPVAVKVVSLQGDEDANHVARELSAMACTDVDGLVGFHEAVGLDTDPPAVAIVLDRVSGGSLAAAVGARGHLSVGEAVTVLAPVARALAELHAAGVVHADVSPTNVLLERSGRPLLADLGVARFVGDRPGEQFGTEGFVAPEVADGALPTTASDVYAVGALAWWCVSGAAPGPAALRPSLEDVVPGLPAAFLEWTAQALATDPARRPDAVALALGYFDSATCEPLRLVVGGDDTSLLTQRLRRSAQTLEEPATGRATRCGRARDRVRGRIVAAAIVTAALAAAGVAIAVGGVSVGGPSWPGTARAPQQPRETVQPRGTPSAGVTDAAADKGAPHRDPRALMQSLADRRARLMSSGSAEGLEVLDVPDSAAMASDRASLAALLAAGERYRDVRFTVRSARLVASHGEVASVEAVVDTSAHVVVREPGSARPQPQAAGEPMVFSLRWGEARWRIESVRAAAG